MKFQTEIHNFNTGPTVLGQGLDLAFSAAGISLFEIPALNNLANEAQSRLTNLFQKIKLPNVTIAGHQFVGENDFYDNAESNARFTVTRLKASIGNLANLAVQFIGAEKAQPGGAGKVIRNGIFAKVLQAGVGTILGFAMSHDPTKKDSEHEEDYQGNSFNDRLGRTISKILQRIGVKDPERADRLGYGYGTEVVNSAISLLFTMLGNSTIKFTRSPG